jgi:hypothetical protein
MRRKNDELSTAILARSAGIQGTYSASGSFGAATLATRGKGRVVVEAKVAGILAGIIHCALLLRPAYNRAFGRITVTSRITR